MEKDIQKVLARQTEARAALAGLPEDVPEAIKKRVVQDVELAEAAVWDLNEWLSKARRDERRKSWTPGNMVSFLLGAALVFSFVMFLGQEPGPDVRAGRSSHQGTAQTGRDLAKSRKFTASASDNSLYTRTAAENIACQQAGFVGAIVEDMVCFPGASGSCTQAEVTISCTISQPMYNENINTLRSFAAKLR